MRARSLPTVLVAFVLLVTGACAGPRSTPVEAVGFAPVALPAGASPEAIAAAGDTLLVGVRREGLPTNPGLVRLGADGATADVPVTASTPYGHTAHWYSIASDGDRIVAIGGDRGGAHGNVRWSAWTGTVAGLGEQIQAFSTFGGWGAGDLVDAVLAPSGALLVGSWQSRQAGFDVTVWLPDGSSWVRQGSAGTPLESTPDALGFATGASAAGDGVLVVGWGVGAGARRGPAPVVWRSVVGNSGWTRTELPDAGTSGTAVAAGCSGQACAVTGRVDGVLAVWRLAGSSWNRIVGILDVPVADGRPLPPPLQDGERLTVIVGDGGPVRVVGVDGPVATVRPVAGPSGVVVDAVAVGRWVYVLAGPDESSLSLWRAEAGTLR